MKTLSSRRVFGRGYTQRAGEAHAEVMALRDASAAGADVAGATAWVTLEPCAHQGRTAPCCDALVQAGIRRVVASMPDPFPAVAGQGFARLRDAGVEVIVVGGEHQIKSRELNIGFLSRVERGRPWVRLKVAVSLDGRTALQDGTSQWITGQSARRDVHRWRRRASAIVTGVGTVLRDDPRLDVRLVATTLQPLCVVMDSLARTPPTARLLQPPGRAVVATGPMSLLSGDRQSALRSMDVEVFGPPGNSKEERIGGLLDLLANREVNELQVEAGATLNAAFLQAKAVDELLVYVAPKLLGPGQPLAALPTLGRLDLAPSFSFEGVERFDEDLYLRLRAKSPSS